MSSRLLFSFLLPLTAACSALFSFQSAEQEMLQNVDIITHTFHINYAPAPWKGEYLGWTIDTAAEKAKKRISENPSPQEFRKAIQEYFRSVHDYHTSIFFNSTAMAALPFKMAKVGNKFYVARVFKLLAPGLVLPLERGDEILRINGVAMTREFEQFMKDLNSENPTPTDIAKAVEAFTERSGARLDPMPKNPLSAVLDVRRKGTNRIEKVTLGWSYHPEGIPLKKGISPWKLPKSDNLTSIEKNHMLSPDVEILGKVKHWTFVESMEKLGITSPQQIVQMDKNDDLVNALQDFINEMEGTLLPPLGKTLWTAPVGNYFQAYIYALPTGERVGFIRLRTFMPYETQNLLWMQRKIQNQAAEPWDEFANLMAFFQENTDALVIDQTDNHGGSSFYLMALLGHLTDRPLALPKHYNSLTSGDVENAVEILDVSKKFPKSDKASVEKFWEELFGDLYENGKVHGYPANATLKEQFVHHFTSVLEHWKRGETYTEPMYMYGTDHILPDEKRYTKPLVVLTDAMDFSCADFFPAILQDNQRAVIFGSKTSGAGGAIGKTYYPNRLGIAGYSFTTTLAIRPNMQPLENLGVTPDVEYTVTENDLANGYKDYAQALIKTIKQEIEKSK